MNLLFIIIYLLWFLMEIILNRLLHSKSTDKQHADKSSLSLIWITIVVTIIVAVFVSTKFYLPISSNPILPYVGLVVIVIGMVVRLIAVVSLGQFFTVDVTIRQNHQLKTNGLYKYLRHPSYFASLLSFIGLGIALNNRIALLLITIAIITAFIIRIKIEEKILIEQFGAAYIEYKRKTSGLIPFIY